MSSRFCRRITRGHGQRQPLLHGQVSAGCIRVVLGGLLLLLTTVSLSVNAAVAAHVDRNPVPVDESLTLTVETDSATSDEPDFSALDNDFDVLGQSSSTSIQIINGQSTRSQKWIVTLMPKRVGKVHIPAFSVAGQHSQPLTLTVTKANQPQSAGTGAEVFLRVEAEPKTAYVQQQVIYTLRLYHSVDLASGSHLSEPQASNGDAIIKRLGQDSEFRTTINGVPYAVVERKYVIFPQKSGQLTIEPVIFNGQIIDPQRGQRFMFSPFNPSVRHKRVRSTAVSLDVDAIPAGMSAATWLPATNLQLQEQWSTNPPQFSVGEPVTRTVAILADGLTAAQLPDLSVPLPAGIKSYPDQPSLKDTVDSNGITAVRQQKIALIPTRPGTFVLPEIRLPWWNTKTGKAEVATLPQRRITVSGAAPAPSPQTTVPATAKPGEPTKATAAETAAPAASPADKVNATAGWWPLLALGLGIAWLVTLLAWLYQQRRRREYKTPDNKRSHASLSQSMQQVKTACKANNANAARTALLDWAAVRWPNAAPTSLTALAKRCSPALAEALAVLDRTLYARDAAVWQGDVLWQAFAADNAGAAKAASRQANDLEPLHRH